MVNGQWSIFNAHLGDAMDDIYETSDPAELQEIADAETRRTVRRAAISDDGQHVALLLDDGSVAVMPTRHLAATAKLVLDQLEPYRKPYRKGGAG
jgi:hypothetical protein